MRLHPDLYMGFHSRFVISRSAVRIRQVAQVLSRREANSAEMTCPPKAVPVRKLVFGTKKGGNNAYQAIYAGTNNQQTARG